MPRSRGFLLELKWIIYLESGLILGIKRKLQHIELAYLVISQLFNEKCNQMVAMTG